MSTQTVLDYYSQPRLDVLNLVPREARSILECGCGFGNLAREIKKRQKCKIYGIELNADAKEKAENIFDKLVIGDLEKIDLFIYNDKFDCIIYADILEHLIDPWKLLAEHVQYLENQGTVIVSIPNIRNLQLLKKLVFKGEWNYTTHGLLDMTHLRFFTLKSAVKMLHDVGLEIEIISKNCDTYSFLHKLILLLPTLIMPELKVCQWLIVAKKY
jgi:2-polyprenyl-3-methyl-5-hydroxy-6-metoxy-1,4-benzoquinol methylase